MKTLKLLFFLVIPFVLSCNHNKPARYLDNMNETGMNMKTGDPGKDQDFVKSASSGGMMEVELGKFAEQNAQNPRVKNYGAMMVRDHTKANEELKAIATGKNINIPESLDESNNKTITSLQKKSGADFDKEYIKDMVNDHQKDIEEFKKQADHGSDPDLKAFATKTLPVLQTHQDSAKSILKSLK